MNIKNYIVIKFSALIFAVILMGSCVSISMLSQEKSSSDISKTDPNINEYQTSIVDAALKACSMNYGNSLIFSGKSFNNDCSGLVHGVYWSAGIDLLAETSTEQGNGVKRLHTVMYKNNLLHTRKIPAPGDLIFWNNTYGTWGKNPLSHIGIVVSADKNGNIEYVHNNTYLGKIVKESMNLYKPHENRPKNNYMRYDGKYKKTSAELFDSFGMAWKI